MKTAPPSKTAAHVERLRQRIGAVRSKRIVVRVMTGATLAISVVVGVFTTEAILDRLVNLPWPARALVFLGCFGSAAFLLWRESIKPLRKRLDDDEIALLIEHALPEFRTRFIASIQLAREAGTRASSLVRALVVQTAVAANSIDFKNVVKTARLKRIMLRCAGIVAAAGALLYFGGAASMPLIERAML